MRKDNASSAAVRAETDDEDSGDEGGEEEGGDAGGEYSHSTCVLGKLKSKATPRHASKQG
jgi:hypothetical protein